MNTLDTHIRLLKSLLNTLKDEIMSLGYEFNQRQRASWPASHQTATIDWRPREETLPAGTAWATDGEDVWLIETDGKPLPTTATSVKMWAQFASPRAPCLKSGGETPP
jgi:hypothetical protein